MTARHLWFDPGFGASGDMVLGALLGLGAPVEEVRDDLAVLGVAGWTLDRRPTTRSGLAATRAVVDVTADDAPHRAWSTIDGLLASAGLESAVADGARRTFALLARVEAGIHRVDVDEVHFHEVGAVDALIDIVGAWSALVRLDVERVHAGPVGLGHGTVPAAHGLLPVPAPATLDLLTGIPIQPVDAPFETVTPTGAALLVTMVDRWGPIPAGRVGRAARGAGGRDPATHPNVVTAVLLDVDTRPDAPGSEGGDRTSDAVVLATNLDDTTPEVLAHSVDALLMAGADDAWVVPVTMKKGRPGHELRVLTTPDLAPALRDLLFRETGTLGIRSEPVTKHRVDRRTSTVTLHGHDVAVKVGPHGTKPEHDDLVVAARATGLPLRQLAIEAIRLQSDAESAAEGELRHNMGPH